MSTNQPDALSALLNGEGQQDPASNPPAPAADNNSELLARMAAFEQKQAELEAENADLKRTLRKAGTIKGPDPAIVGKPYRGPLEIMIHPSTGQEVEIKPELVESATAQGFKKLPASKKK